MHEHADFFVVVRKYKKPLDKIRRLAMEDSLVKGDKLSVVTSRMRRTTSKPTFDEYFFHVVPLTHRKINKNLKSVLCLVPQIAGAPAL